MSRSRNVANRTQTGSPHIITTKLHPAYLGKLIDGTTSHSGAYGTEQSDGRMYYYTSIAGSKPIHDPRIGAHFGSHRHEIASIQVLEQETATHGDTVYAIDGRSWMRCTGGGWSWINDGHGSRLKGGNVSSYPDMYIEVVGYFNGFNFCAYTDSNHRIRYSLDGGTEDGVDHGSTTQPTPLGSRYLDPSSVINIPISTSLGIHTIKLRSNGLEHDVHAIELIVQDTTDSASRSKIQIPKQSVYTGNGKHEVPAQAVHYDPFNGMTTASGFGGYVDEKSSLGLEKWKVGATCYRPYNGGRVIKWVDVDGVVKTSVTCMPPNAKSFANSSSLTNGVAKSDASALNDTFYPTFETHTTSVNEDQLHETAKTFHWREFGNGSGNQGAGSNIADASTLDSDDDIAYMMDDGLTGFVGKDVDKHATYDAWDLVSDGESAYYSFVGTGFSIQNINTATLTYTYDIYVDGILVANDVTLNDYKWVNLCQNLPYGTHFIRFVHAGSSGGEVATFNEISFHQPKKPPIPEDACILADYMLMADFKPQTTTTWGHISKGVITKHNSREFLYDAPSGTATGVGVDFNVLGINSPYVYIGNVAGTITQQLPFFGTSFVQRFNTRATYSITSGTTYTVNGSDLSSYALNAVGSGQGGITNAGVLTKVQGDHENMVSAVGGTLGTNILSITETGASNLYTYPGPIDIAIPIHTSHHYQPFETPLLKELVAGDRNLEQTNLVVSSSGETWDQLTRNTSYIGNRDTVMNRTNNTAASSTARWIIDECRGTMQMEEYGNKSFAIAYNSLVCLEDGMYIISYGDHSSAHLNFKINGNFGKLLHNGGGNGYVSTTFRLKRGDLVSFEGGWSHSSSESYLNNLNIYKA